jgi:hypothetical protein
MWLKYLSILDSAISMQLRSGFYDFLVERDQRCNLRDFFDLAPKPLNLRISALRKKDVYIIEAAHEIGMIRGT